MSHNIKLSVNINKIALIRNSREGNNPDLIRVAKDCEAFGADGITVHPRPDERHVRFADLPLLKEIVTTEFNIEGNPSNHFLQEVVKCRPHQCTLVPDSPEAKTSDHGWDTLKNRDELKRVTDILKKAGIRVSVFLDPDIEMVEGAADAGVDRVEFYTGPYAHHFHVGREEAVRSHIMAASRAQALGLGVNAGHDLNLENLSFYAQNVPGLLEVSIGHALVIDALYYGLANAIGMYKRKLMA
jgi:pyridoxine 5-phosphate synthase